MTNQQGTPEALRLADALDGNARTNWTREEAAAELRRLHQSEREGWRYANELEQERKLLHAEIADLRAQLEAAQLMGAAGDAAVPAKAAPTEDVRQKIGSNTWDHFGDILPTLKAISHGDWYWGANTRCKYIEIRLDTRDGGCILYDRERVRISPEQFAHQAGGGCGKMEPWPATNAIPPSSAKGGGTVSPIPKLPSEISPDGKEIWDWAARLSAQAHRADEVRRLTQQIKNAETQCGSCAHWMTRQCPREQHSNKTGRSAGPSSQSLKCSEFAMTAHQAKSLEAAKAKLSTLIEGETP